MSFAPKAVQSVFGLFRVLMRPISTLDKLVPFAITACSLIANSRDRSRDSQFDPWPGISEGPDAAQNDHVALFWRREFSLFFRQWLRNLRLPTGRAWQRRDQQETKDETDAVILRSSGTSHSIATSDGVRPQRPDIGWLDTLGASSTGSSPRIATCDVQRLVTKPRPKKFLR